jgi:hypothetical protein
MAERPLLVFPRPAVQDRQKGHGGPVKLHLPSAGQQRKRLGPQFKELEKAFTPKAAKLQPSLAGASPEQVIVFETVGPIDHFVRNVKKIEGMEWLAEQVAEFEPDDDFHQVKPSTKKQPNTTRSEKKLSGRLFVVLSNHKALQQLLSFWKRYKKGDTFPHGEGRWKQLFQHLRTVRTWDASDRLHRDVLEDWKLRVEEGAERVRVEIELWFRAATAGRSAAEERLTTLVADEEGAVLSRVALSGIAYHAMLVELPIGAVQKLMGHADTKLVRCSDIMFFRPAPQLAAWTPADSELEMDLSDAAGASPDGDPVVALLDGLPLEQHEALAGRLVVDDPDGWSSDYPASKRAHGTAMASLILHGDMHSPGPPLARPLYVRPVLQPAETSDGKVAERMPADRLPVDVIHRAVRRLFEGDGGEPPVAPTVRIINFSVGDGSRVFDSEVSPLARLLDWLAVKYRVLFVVSAGNHVDGHPDYLTLDIPIAEYAGGSVKDIELATIRALNSSAHARRLLSPAEAMNVLTVGALQRDDGPQSAITSIRELVCSPGCPSPLSALGLGYGRSVKPDILVSGGRAHFRPAIMQSSLPQFSLVDSGNAPGCRVAAVGAAGSLRGYANSCGTSNAAALASREAARLLDVVQGLTFPDESEDDAVPDEFVPLVLRALLVHSSRWGDARKILEEALKEGLNAHTLKQHLARFLGYGAVDPARVAECTEQRATIISTGYIKAEEGHTYSFPLPQDLAGRKVWRRLAVTLAWMSPINPETRAYRQAKLWIDPPRDTLRVRRSDADDDMVRRGTIQHEVLEGEQASVFSVGDTLSLVVNCQPESATEEPVPYVLAATLEVAPGEQIQVYDQVRNGLRALVKVPAQVMATA